MKKRQFFYILTVMAVSALQIACCGCFHTEEQFEFRILDVKNGKPLGGVQCCGVSLKLYGSGNIAHTIEYGNSTPETGLMTVGDLRSDYAHYISFDKEGYYTSTVYIFRDQDAPIEIVISGDTILSSEKVSRGPLITVRMLRKSGLETTRASTNPAGRTSP